MTKDIPVTFIFLAMLLLPACREPVRQKIFSSEADSPVLVEKHKPASNFQDTLRITSAAAVFYHPDSLQNLAIKAITDSGIYKSTVHEFFYQMRYSRKVLQKYYPSLAVIEAKNIRYLLFQKKNGDTICIDLDANNDASGMYVFDGLQKPQLLDMTNIETELSFYFKKTTH